MRFRFQVRIGSNVSRSIARTGRSITIGRNAGCDVIFSPEESDVVSGQHARIDVTPKGILLTDLQSTNGTYVNGTKVESPVSLSAGQEIRLGSAGPIITIEQIAEGGSESGSEDHSEKAHRTSPAVVAKRVSIIAPVVEKPVISSESINKPLVPLSEIREVPGPSKTRVMLEDLQQQNHRNWIVAAAIGGTVVTAIGVALLVMSKETAAVTGDQIYKDTLLCAVWVVNDTTLPVIGSIQRSTGSGVIVDLQERLVITNFHVVANGSEVKKEVDVYFPEFRNGVLLTEKSEYTRHSRSSRARVLEADETTDLAVLQLDWHPEAAKAVPLAAVPAVAGEDVYTIGNPQGDSLWVHSEGAVRQRQHKEYMVGGGGDALHINAYVLDTQTPINPGDSGGPVVNASGRLVGINHSHSVNDRLVTHAIDIEEVKRILHRAGSQVGH